jgi:dCMP deaminase
MPDQGYPSFFESWPEFFMSMAFFVGMKSKDPLSKVGAVIVTNEHQIVSVGYNGFPRGVNDEDTKRHERPMKYWWSIHAERNSIYNASYTGASVKGCTLYTQWFPCTVCAQTIINAGIKRVVHYYPRENGMGHQPSVNVGVEREDWARMAIESDMMFYESGVQAELWHGPLFCGPIVQVCNGVLSTPKKEDVL